MIAAPGLSLNECRGSVESVTGMPRRVLAATSWTRLCHSAISAAELAAPNTLKCVMCRSRIISALSAIPNSGFGPATVPPSPMVIIVWKNSPAFSSSVIWPRRFSTRSSSGRPASRKAGSTGRASGAAAAAAVAVGSVVVVSVIRTPSGVTGERFRS
jgi:hypothetical protein